MNCVNGKCGNHAGRFPSPTTTPRNVEFFVRYPDGTDSEPQPTVKAAFELAEATGGKARARASVERDTVDP
jgi:hypothetical protein